MELVARPVQARCGFYALGFLETRLMEIYTNKIYIYIYILILIFNPNYIIPMKAFFIAKT